MPPNPQISSKLPLRTVPSPKNKKMVMNKNKKYQIDPGHVANKCSSKPQKPFGGGATSSTPPGRHLVIVDVNAAPASLRDDRPAITGLRKTVWPSLCAAMADWMGCFVMDRAGILHMERASWKQHGVLRAAYAWDMFTIAMGM